MTSLCSCHRRHKLVVLFTGWYRVPGLGSGSGSVTPATVAKAVDGKDKDPARQ